MKTLTFTIEDALLSEISLAMLTGADMAEVTSTASTYVHSTYDIVAGENGALVLSDKPELYVVTGSEENVMPIYGALLNEAGAAKKYFTKPLTYAVSTGTLTLGTGETVTVEEGDIVRIDAYEKKTSGKIFNITPDKFAGYYYIEASTLFRDEETGSDFPAEFVIPRGKIQSNFTFTMASSGDPSEQMRMAA